MSWHGDTLVEVYQRLHAFGPEFGGDEEGNHGMTNHGPMAMEDDLLLERMALHVTQQHLLRLAVDVHRWLDRYVTRLAELPRGNAPIAPDAWELALGDGRRLPDWTSFFRAELRAQPWTRVLRTWWPRLLPGIAAGSTHGVIRVGHAVRALQTSQCNPPDVALLDELAHGLAFWAARYRELPSAVPAGALAPDDALAAVTRLREQAGFIAHRLERLARSDDWVASIRRLRPAGAPEEAPSRLEVLVEAATRNYLVLGHAAPVLLVHVATAPNAVRHVLPVLPSEQWEPSLHAAWTAAAAIVAAYAPVAEAPFAEMVRVDGGTPRDTPADTLGRAAAHGDEHVLKFADTAVEAYERTGDPDLLAAVTHASRLIAAP